MLIIDGSRGEGGGQVLRTALGLSLATGTPFHIEHLADQLLIPLALAARGRDSGGTFRAVPPTRHTTTNAEVIGRFLDVRFTFAAEGEGVLVGARG